jgi:hypothetical protein
VLVAMGIAGAAVLPIEPVSRAGAEDAGAQVKQVMAEKLPNVPGKSISAVLASFPRAVNRQSTTTPAAFSSMYCRARSGPRTPQPVRPRCTRLARASSNQRGSEHLISENASASEPARLLVVFVADDGAQLTTFEK